MRNQDLVLSVAFRGLRKKSARGLLSIRTFCLLILTLGYCEVCESQGSFPDIINGAAEKPISTADGGTCGYNSDSGLPANSIFCRSSSFSSSLSTCTPGRCIQTCPQRTTLPVSSELSDGSLRGTCVSQDFINVRPGSELGSHSIIFQNNPDCFISPNVPISGNNGELSISVWIRQDVSQDSTIIVRGTQANASPVYSVMISSGSIIFDYMTTAGPRFLTTQSGLLIGQWQHLAIQVYGTKISFFINGLEQDGTPFETQTLVGEIVDISNAETRVGQRLTGATQFVGRMQDLRVFQNTLTNREIEELATGHFPELHVQSECRCPDSHPRINPANSRYCIQNGVPDTTSDEVMRLNGDAHPLTYANDGDHSTYWVSNFVDDLTLDIDLSNGQYQVFYVVLQFYSPQPTALTISRRKTDSDDWEPWQYFAQDCSHFSLPNDGPLQSATSVNCIQFESNPLYSKSNITFQLLAAEPNERPGYNDFFNTPDLLEFALATQVRIRMQGHYYVTHSRHEYYGIEEVTVSTRCQCNGHASTCDTEADPYQCNCLLESFTAGRNCERCESLYNDKPYRHGDWSNAYNCKPCLCHGHALSCVYNSSVDPYPDDHDRGGGGVCVDCMHNTQGRLCDECRTGFYREEGRALDAFDVCSPCLCNANGTVGGSFHCEPIGGQCNCKLNVQGRTCDTCKNGYFDLRDNNPLGCDECLCDPAGSTSGDCDTASGGCDCKANVIGERCDACNFGYYNLSFSNPLGCQLCQCDDAGSTSIYCNPSNGQCSCKTSTQGLFCDECKDGFFGLSSQGCQRCDCDASGTVPGTSCDKATGQCICKTRTMGRRCDQCQENSYNLLGVCTACSCNTAGTVNGSASCHNSTGQCQCKANVVGLTCNQCAPDTYGLNADDDGGCSPCNCDPSGTSPGGFCDQNTGQCPCLTNRQGRRCDACSSGYFISLTGDGCQECTCNPLGTQNGVPCNSVSGQCVCRGDDSGVTGMQCDSCLPGYFNFDATVGSCDSCDCDARGSTSNICDALTGQCSCKELVTGRRCSTCQPGSSNLRENNPQGCTKEPEQQPPPTWLPVSPYAISLSWGPPDQPNGVIIAYTVIRNGTRVTTGLFGDLWNSIQTYQDSSLSPYTTYSYVIEASNQAGSTQSPPVTARTPDAIPAGFDVLTVSNVRSRSANFAWSKPSDLSAPVINYILTSVTPSNPSPPMQHYSGLDTEYRALDLIPFSNYTFTLTVCTEGSCGEGQPVTAFTQSAAPEGVVPPTITAIDQSALFVSWDHPLEANGIITHYELFIRGPPNADGVRDPPETRIFYPAGWYNPRPVVTSREEPAHPPATNFTYEGVLPFTLYEFKVTAKTQAGTGESDWVAFRSFEAVPLSMPAPSAQGTSSTSLNVTWDQPPDQEVRGVIIEYSLYQIVTSTIPFAPPEFLQLIYSNNGSSRHYEVEGLDPYQDYSFVVKVCNSLGCVESGKGTGRTLPAAPTDQVAPLVEGQNATSMLVSWSAPLNPNGPEPAYTLQRAPVAFSTPPPRVEKGARFTGAGYYKFPASVLPVSAYTGIDLEFRVNRPEGSASPVNALLFFAASEGNQEEYLVLQLRDGRPWFLFDPQGGAVGVTPADGGLTYDDGQWHRIRINRISTLGSIIVDEFHTGTATAPTSSNIIGQTTGVYIGGLPTDFVIRRSDQGNLAVIREGFAGCLRNVRIERSRTSTSVWEDLIFSTSEVQQDVVSSWQGCPSNLQSGAHFPGYGHVTLPSSILAATGGFNLSLTVRTEFLTGTILFSHGGNGQFLHLRLVQGRAQLTITAVSGTTTLLEIDDTRLCDGQWYRITISVVGPLVSISVPGETRTVSFQVPSLTSLYFGGVPDSSDAHSMADITAFGGCMKELTVNNVPISFHTGEVLNVYLDGCPSVPGTSCASATTTEVYAGPSRIVNDHNLQVFTEYMYRVMATNSIGSTSSVWSTGRTREGVPTGLNPPNDPMSLDGYTISVNWQRPAGNTGVLTQYVLLAYNQDIPLLTPVTAIFTDTSLDESSGNITGVIPYTNYLVSLRACTASGCSESSGVPVFTLEEAPDGVQPPTAATVGGRFLDLEWLPPVSPNGVILSYRLTMNGAEIYRGSARNHTQTGLSVFTGYRFTLAACTSVGCSNSPEVSITTSQLPPESVTAPRLFVSGPTSIEAQWSAPSSVNGILERYVLFVSDTFGTDGEPVYNSTVLLTDFVIRDLTPGTFYYIAVMACSGGGCTISPPGTARTSESAPEGVQAPTVVAASSSQLDISWLPPDQPNGVIISYVLIHNNIPIQNSTQTTATVTGLAPWSLQVFRLEACTSAGCSYSPEVQARTQEAPPLGTITLSVSPLSARTVNTFWSSPAQPNGDLIYDVLFDGLFYVAPEMNEYSTVRETRVLLNTTVSNWMFVIDGLIPDSPYSVTVRASNTRGSVSSNEVRLTMPKGSPDGVLPPVLTPSGPTSILASWTDPARNNAPGSALFLLTFRPAGSPGAQEELFSTPTRATSFPKTGLEAYTEFEFRLTAVNNYGSTETPWVSVFTLEAAPGPVDPPMATIIDANTLHVSWEQPTRPNGIIRRVNIYQNDLLRTILPGNTTGFTADGLVPFTEYVFKVEVCNSEGCSLSPPSATYLTPQAAPSGQDPPTLRSDTPTSVIVTWQRPTSPNGDLIGYEVERRMVGSSAVFTVEIVDIDEPRRYRDVSPSITPFTAYEYRIRVSSPAGSHVSLWAAITTLSASPGGLRPPSVDVLGPSSFLVMWDPPTEANGVLLSYTIRMPQPIIYLDNVTVTTYVVESLIPYTDYEVTIEACTIAGCTESDSTPARTHPAPPEGQDAPRADPITQTYISVLWSAPTFPNGPGIRYSLQRQKVRQPLETGIVFGLGFWELIYNGTQTSFQDRGLTTFTTYLYRVTTFNQIGFVTSDASEEATTLAGFPLQAGTLMAVALDHVSVLVDWTTPSLLQLQGSVVQYYIRINSSADARTLSYPPDINSTVLTSLRPNTVYVLELLISNGAYNVTSDPVTAETLDGAPEGFDDPQFRVLSASSVQIMWRVPSQPNGDVLSYTILLDEAEVEEVPESTLSYIISQLQPYTVYSVRVKVCTVYDCLLSNATIFTTLEVTPSGISPPSLVVLGPTAMRVRWAQPTLPNGIIQRYELLRRELRPCTESISPEESNTCGYVECSTTESVCGRQCYSGSKVCCGGTIHDYQPDYQCCDTNYIPIPASEGSYVCCGGQFHSSQEDYQCCNGQYVEVLPGQICCSDPSQDRVVVGLGDSCCEGVPYDSSGPQICCAGTFADGFSSKCCGSSVVPVDRFCCEENGEGRDYEENPNYVCCGLEYVAPETTLCCTTEGGFSRAHLYLSEEDKLSREDQCCGLEKIAPSDACCNGIGYNLLSHVCADRSSMGEGGCGLGVICPVDQAVTAYCDRCDFDPNTMVCASVEGQFSDAPSPTTPSNVRSICPSALTTVFSTGATTYSYLDTELSPYTTYEYAVSVHNTAGSATSQLVNATTNEAIPSGVQPPLWSVPIGVLDRIQLTWNEPIKPNGEIQTYILNRDGIEIFRGLADSFTDRNGIQPYQEYSYILSACTEVGCASSPEIVAATLQAAPDMFADPLVIGLDAYSVQVTWQSPTTTNGIIREYQVHQIGIDDPVYAGDSDSFLFVHEGLTPFTSYEYTVTACTFGGCTTTNPVTASTLEAPPEGVFPPTHVIYSAFIIELYWREPSVPNGIITEYRLYRDGISIYRGGENVRTFFDEGLSRNTRYEYVLEALTGAGGTNSSTHIAQTPVDAPEGIPGPTLVVISSTAIRATWTEPTIPNGEIVQYGLILMSGKVDQALVEADNDTFALVENLSPYTLYDIRVLACNDGGCGVGPKVDARTFEAPPEGQDPPELQASGPSVVEISWSPPAMPNGIITNYFIYRRNFRSLQELLVCVENGLENSCINAGQGLLAFSLYEYKVRVVNNEGETESTWASIRTLEAPPSGVSTPVVLAVDSSAAQASWVEPSQANGVILGYRIEYQEISNDPILTFPVVVAATVDGNTFLTTFYGLSPFTAYNVRIVAFNGAGESSSPWSEVKTAEGVPGNIGLFEVEQNPDGLSMLLRWSPPGMPNGEITVYRIYEDEYLITPIYVGRTREYLFRRLSPFTEYTLVLEACTSAGCGRGHPQTVITAETAPDNQAEPIVGTVDSDSVQLMWRPPVNPNGVISYYEVIRRSSVEGPSTRRRRDTDDSTFTHTQVVHTEYNTNGDSFEYTDSSLLPFRTYEYRISAVNSKGNTQSDWVSVQTDEAPPSGVLPPSIEFVSNIPDSLLITWVPPVESNGIISGYRLQRNGSAPFSFDSDDELSYLDTGLEPYTIYGYSVIVCSGGGCTSSPVATVRTLESAPISVNPPDPMAISATEIRVNWTMPSLETGAIINLQLKVDGTVVNPDLATIVVIEDLIPFQEYEFVLVACTSGGCSESEPSFERPFAAAPEGMAPPSLRALDSRRVEVSWSEPDYPNGIILRYELRRDGKLVYDGSAMRWQDFGDDGSGLTPGQEYSYVVTAVNSEGRAISDPAYIVTSADTPAGLDPPTLTPISSSVITVEWQSPLFPNGQIQNFTLFRDGNRIYSGLAMNFDAISLNPYTEYSFFIQACTNQGCAASESVSARTMESPPQRQLQPTLTPLADNSGVASGIRAEWNPPSEANGVILGYQLFRRRIFRPSGITSEPLMLFNSTTSLQYNDLDPRLMPDENYEYMVISRNEAGEAASPWAITRMLEARPEGVPPPVITDIAATTATIKLFEPSQPNGRIVEYLIFRNQSEVGQTDVTLFQDFGLEPFTFYSYTVRACTSVGCSDSNQTTIQTAQDTPSGLDPPTVVGIGSNWIYIEWEYPLVTNGIISQFEVLHRPACPFSEQPFDQPCQEVQFRSSLKDLSLAHNMSALSPYTKYEFKVRAYNDADFVESSAVSQVTSVSDPRYIQAMRPSITSNTTTEAITIDWTGTFELNGELEEYILLENGDEVYSGVSTTDTRPFKGEDYEFVIRVVTNGGEASSPAIIFSLIDTGGSTGSISTEWYQSIWFIAIVILIGIVILFILIGIALSRMSPSKPYERERQPLPPRQRRAHNFTFASSFKYPDTESIMDDLDDSDSVFWKDPIPKSISRASSMHSLRNSYSNPSFPPPYPNSRPASRVSDSAEKAPLKYLSDDEGVWDDPSPIPVKLDSGMVSMGDYEDDQMTNVSQTYSFTKEQTMFTDTHL